MILNKLCIFLTKSNFTLSTSNKKSGLPKYLLLVRWQLTENNRAYCLKNNNFIVLLMFGAPSNALVSLPHSTKENSERGYSVCYVGLHLTYYYKSNNFIQRYKVHSNSSLFLCNTCF